MAENKLVWSAKDIATRRFPFRHPRDDAADVAMVPLGHATGLQRTSMTLVHLETGCVSFPKHRHQFENEWIYIISGHATREMDEGTHVPAPGSFAGFPACGPAHKLTNTGEEPLIYLMGGDRQEVEIVDFTDAGQRMTRIGAGSATTAEIAPSESFAPFNFMARMRDDG